MKILHSCHLLLSMTVLGNTTQHRNGNYLDDGTIRKIIPVIMSANFGMPESFQRFVSSLTDEDASTARDGGYGCDDPFAIFGFLAFLLALLQLLVDSGGDEARKKRSTYQCSHEQALKNSPELKEGVLGAYIMFQGFLNAVDVGRDHNYRSIIKHY